jgi:2-methyl-1,2-propanediol dehydrogenase
VLGEILPDPRNRVTIHPTANDHNGLPVPYVQFNLFENDKRMMAAGIARARTVLSAAGATETHFVPRFAHLVGTCRMGFTPQDSVVDQWCRSWDVPNLLVCDGSVLVTQGSSNPALTISALAARTAGWLRRAVPAGELSARPRAESAAPAGTTASTAPGNGASQTPAEARR